jgi:O-succinylbenzoate synthase
MSDPLYQVVHYLNSNLTDLGVKLKVGMETTVRTTVIIGPLEHETDLHVRITEEGWELAGPEAQVQRIEEEIRDRLAVRPRLRSRFLEPVSDLLIATA